MVSWTVCRVAKMGLRVVEKVEQPPNLATRTELVTNP